jgi:hypothetical protein
MRFRRARLGVCMFFKEEGGFVFTRRSALEGVCVLLFFPHLTMLSY